MNNRNDHQESNKLIVALLVVFFAIILREATINSLSWTEVTLMGAILIGLSLTTLLIPDQKTRDQINDR